MENNNCPVCGNATLSEDKVGRTPILRCTTCNVAVTPHELRSVNESRFYEDAYVMTPSSRASVQQFRYSRYPEYVRLLSEISALRPSPGRWLDIGCGSGEFLEECRHAGYEVEGVEVSSKSANEAKRAGIIIHRALHEVEGPLDVVSMWHVLEHLQEPRETLQSVRSLIRPDGVLCIRVPNFSGRWSRILSDHWVWFQPHQHTVHFGPDSLRRLLDETGFSVIKMRTQRPNSLLVRRAYDLAAVVFNRYAKTEKESATARITRLLKDMSAEEIFVVAKLKP